VPATPLRSGDDPASPGAQEDAIDAIDQPYDDELNLNRRPPRTPAPMEVDDADGGRGAEPASCSLNARPDSSPST
jgi:hypothetical protein